jgi:hypothetical protein
MPWLIEVHDLANAVHRTDFMRANDVRPPEHCQHAKERFCSPPFILLENVRRVWEDIERRIPKLVQTKTLDKGV